jgi:signal transduction histidine kinase
LAQTWIDEYRVIILSVVAAISIYIVDAAIDTYIFLDGPFLDVLLTLDPGEVSLRLYISGSFVLFGIVASKMISNRRKAEHEIRKRSDQMASLMKTSAEVIHCTDVKKQLQIIAEAIRELGWRRVVIRVTDRNMDLMSPEDMVTVGLADEEKEILWNTRQPGKVWRERIGPQYERFRIGEFFHLPMSDSWVRDKFSKGSAPSKLVAEKMVDSNSQELLYAPLVLAGGQVVGLVSIDDPVDEKEPTKESLGPLELFLHEAAVAIENARLIELLNTAKVQVQEYANQLEEKVEDRTRELVEAQKRLLESERFSAIGELAAMIGHDLRNPLTAILNAAYYLRLKAGSDLDPKVGEMLDIIDKDVEYSNKIVSDLLEYSRAIRLDLSKSTPKSILKEALALVNTPANVQILDFTEDKPNMKVDIDKMKRVCVNVIKNAFDAMPEGGKLTIKSKKAGGNVEIVFADTGAGIPKETLARLFMPLFTTKARGMGFGLTICKRIIEAHGGKISAESTLGKGTTFTVSLPVNLKPEKDDKITSGLSEPVSSKALLQANLAHTPPTHRSSG